jgi:hypothetical protein
LHLAIVEALRKSIRCCTRLITLAAAISSAGCMMPWRSKCGHGTACNCGAAIEEPAGGAVPAFLNDECGDICPHTGGFLGNGRSTYQRLCAIGSMPRDVFARTANFCIEPVAYAPADLPPPGRFHPLPTQPVFSPRGPAIQFLEKH